MSPADEVNPEWTPHRNPTSAPELRVARAVAGDNLGLEAGRVLQVCRVVTWAAGVRIPVVVERRPTVGRAVRDQRVHLSGGAAVEREVVQARARRS